MGIDVLAGISTTPVNANANANANALVMYYWRQCRACHTLADSFVNLSNMGDVRVLAVDAYKHRETLLAGGAQIRAVPHVVAYSASGVAHVVNPRIARVPEALSLVARLQSISVAPTDVRPGMVVLYYYHECPHCQKFVPEYLRAQRGADFVAINTRQHPGVLTNLNPGAGSRTVPHVVYHGRNGKQVAFAGNRISGELEAFAESQRSRGPRDAANHISGGQGRGRATTGVEWDAVTVVDPDDIVPSTIVLYFSPTCPHCVTFAPEFEKFAAAALDNGDGVLKLAINTNVHRAALSELKDPPRGVPHVIFYGEGGEQTEYDGPRTAEGLEAFVYEQAQSQKLDGGGNNDNDEYASLEPLLRDPEDIAYPALVLYFRRGCPFCTSFAPQYGAVPGALDASVTAKVQVVAVDVEVYTGALSRLATPASGVPHVVYVSADNVETTFRDRERSTQELVSFLKEQQGKEGVEVETAAFLALAQQNQNRNQNLKQRVHFRGGGIGGDGDVTASGATDTEEHIYASRQELREIASDTLGEEHEDIFEPERASVCFIGLACSKHNPRRDRLYVMLMPKVDVLGPNKMPVFAVMYGPRHGKLKAVLHQDKNPATLLERKRNAGYHGVRETHPLTEHMRDMGYLTRVQVGKGSGVL